MSVNVQLSMDQSMLVHVNLWLSLPTHVNSCLPLLWVARINRKTWHNLRKHMEMSWNILQTNAYTGQR